MVHALVGVLQQLPAFAASHLLTHMVVAPLPASGQYVVAEALRSLPPQLTITPPPRLHTPPTSHLLTHMYVPPLPASGQYVVAEALQSLPPDLTITIAGRSSSKLQALAAQLGNPKRLLVSTTEYT
jgi:hypothetical protein